MRHLRKSSPVYGEELLFWTDIEVDHIGRCEETDACQYWPLEWCKVPFTYFLLRSVGAVGPEDPVMTWRALDALRSSSTTWWSREGVSDLQGSWLI